MNDEVRQAVKQALRERGMTQKDLAKELGMHESNLSALLNGDRGKVPENWQRILEALGLRLRAVKD